jgi:hypothetical protein
MTDQIDIDFKNLEWPSKLRFPRNDLPETVRDVVFRDLQESESPLTRVEPRGFFKNAAWPVRTTDSWLGPMR